MVIYSLFACHRWFSLSKIVNKFKNSSEVHVYIWMILNVYVRVQSVYFLPWSCIWTSSNFLPAMGVLPSDHVDTHQPQEELYKSTKRVPAQDHLSGTMMVITAINPWKCWRCWKCWKVANDSLNCGSSKFLTSRTSRLGNSKGVRFPETRKAGILSFTM